MHSLGGGSQWGNSRGARRRPAAARARTLDDDALSAERRRQRRPGHAGRASPPRFDDAEASQDAGVIAVGARVRHASSARGTIAELAGAGRDAKARIDFDDETIGRKTLVVAQANLERDID